MSSSGLSVNDIMSDINQVLLKHLNSIVNKYENDRNQFEDFLKNIPLVKNVIEENKSLKKLVKQKEEQIQFLDSNIKSLSKMYSSVVLRNKRFECKFNDPINFGIEITRETSSQKKNTDTPDKQNITLEVDDNEKETNISEQEIEDEVESNLHKQQQEFLKSITINNNENNNHSDDDSHDLWEGQLEDYNYDDEDDEEADDEEADDEEAEEKTEEEADEEEVEEDADKEEADEEEAEEEEAEEEDEEEVIEITIDGKTFYGNEKQVGNIYEYLEDGEVGDEIGQYVNGEAILF